MTKVAVVTGASRGVGRGIATALAEAGYSVFATGRTVQDANLPANVRRLACDHLQSDATREVFETVARECGTLDLLVNAAWGGYERMSEDGRFTWAAPFWEQPAHRWPAMMEIGVRSAFECSAHAARLMMPKRRGLIVNLSFWVAQKHIGNAVYGIAKAATDKMTADLAHELEPHGIAVLSLYPGLVRTELVVEAARQGAFDLSNSESPEFSGRVIAALAELPDLLSRTGSVLVGAGIARELGVVDLDGSSPMPLTRDDA